MEKNCRKVRRKGVKPKQKRLLKTLKRDWEGAINTWKKREEKQT